MSQINVSTIRNRTGGPPSLDQGVVVTGIVTATTGEFAGDVTVGGTLTYEDVTNIDSVGLVTAKSGIKVGNPVSPGIGATIDPNGNAVFAGIVTANSFRGDGSLLTGIDATAIQTGNTSVQTVDTGSDGHVKMTTEGGERVRVGPAGQIGLGGANYGTSGQMLTSGGSGSAPTWTTVSSAPEVSGTANSDITAGKPVVTNADGSISQVKYTYTEKGTIVTSATGQTISNGYNADQVKVAHDSTNDQVLYFWKNANDSNAGEINIGTISGSTGNNVSSSSNIRVHNTIEEPFGIAWSKTSAVGVALYAASGGIFAEAFTSDGSSLTFGTRVTVVTNNSKWGTISWDASADKFLVVIGKSASGDAQYGQPANCAASFVLSVSGTTITVGTVVVVKSTEAEHASLAYDSDNNRHLLCYSDYQDGEKLAGRIITVSGTTPTIGAETKLSDNNNYGVTTAYITGGKFITYYNKANEGYARIVTIGGGNAVTFNAQSSNIGDNTLGGIGNNGIGCAYDIATGKVSVVYRLTSGPNDGALKFLTLDTSANTITAISSVEYLTGSANNSVSVVYVPTKLMHVAGFKLSNSHGGTTTFTTADATTNITGENYLGLANASYTNGQTATIRVSGSTQDNQTGLTPGQNYFVQNDGSLSLTAANPNVYAGTAVSSTQLLVGKSSSFGVSPWVEVARYKGAPALDNNTIYEDFANQSYKRYKLIYQVEGTASNLSYFGLEVKAGGSWKSGSNNYTMLRSTRRHNAMDERQTNETRIWLVSEAVKFLQGEITFYDPNSNSYFCNFCSDSYAMITGNSVSTYSFQFAQTNGAYVSNNFNSTVPIQGIRFRWGVNGLNNLDWLLLAAP